MTLRANQSASFSLSVASGDQLDVRHFAIREQMSSLFSVAVTVVAENADIDFEALIGQPARFEVQGGVATEWSRAWTGICKEVQEVAAEETGLSTYVIEIVPVLWLASQRRNHRMFQLMSEVEIALVILSEWGIDPVQKLSTVYKKRKYRVQYGESDYAFICRLLEDAGVSFYFATEGDETRMVLADTPQNNEKREPKIRFRDNPGAVDQEHVTALRIVRQVRPGRYTLRDHDSRRPAGYKLLASATQAQGIEQQLESFHYAPGAFLYENDKGEATPTADDKGRYRTDEVEATAMARRRLEVKRSEAISYTFESNAIDLAPGVVIGVSEHPRQDLGDGRNLLILSSNMTCTVGKAWNVHCEARRADVPFRPALLTPKPKVNGVESATVVGPSGEEIHTDEFGRIRVHFHWDRESEMNENSSCWIHVSQPWGGAGYGGVNLPRIGQEVLVDFLGGDPDRPVIVGRVYTNLQKVPYKLPGSKTQSGWKSNSTNATGGYNELMFEDAAGSELLRMQAEKDMHTLVKNDQRHSVGRDRVRDVGRNEDVLIGKNLSKQVTGNEREKTGINRSITVGVNRTAQIGSKDVTMVGNTFLVMITPPGETGPSTSSSFMMTDKKIVLDTGAGATITMENAKITIEADVIEVFARDHMDLRGNKRGIDLAAPKGNANIVTGDSFAVSVSGSVGITGSDVSIGGDSISVVATGVANIGGLPLQLNGPGPFAGRVMELAPATITTGAATVMIGGASFPFTVEKQGDDLKIGNGIIISGTDAFKGKVLGRLGVISTTPAGRDVLNTINSSGKTVHISEFKGDNSFSGPTDVVASCPKGEPVFDGEGKPVLGPDGKQLIGTGTGSDTEIQLNPDLTLNNDSDPDHPMPNDAVLFHEMTHTAHQMKGEANCAPDNGPPGFNFDTDEEKRTISTGNPNEAEYLRQRNYPFHRLNHGADFAPN